jgi:hypothetical protein
MEIVRSLTSAAPRPICRRPACTNPIASTPGQRGRPAVYCSHSCRQKAYEERKAAEAQLRRSQDVLAQYEDPIHRDAFSDRDWGPDALDAAGALLLHARRAAATLAAAQLPNGPALSSELLRAIARLEELLSAAPQTGDS